MNCHEIRAEIAQVTEGAPAPEIVAHTRECAACDQALSEMVGEQKWLQERFDEVSAHLLAHAPPFSGLDFRQHSARPAWRGPLFPLAWAAVLLSTAVIGWWAWTSSPIGASKSSFAKEPVKRSNRAITPERLEPVAPLSGLNTGKPNEQSSWLAETSPLPTLPGEYAPSQPSAELAVPETSPEIVASTPSPAANSPLDTGVYKMQPSAFAPDANGYLAAIAPTDAADQAPALVALSLNGLPTESDFYIRTKDAGGNYVWLGSGRTNLTGSAVVVMLRGGPQAAGRPLAVPTAATEPPVTLNFDGATGEDLVVVNAGGDVLLTVAPAAPTTVTKPPGSP